MMGWKRILSRAGCGSVCNGIFSGFANGWCTNEQTMSNMIDNKKGLPNLALVWSNRNTKQEIKINDSALCHFHLEIKGRQNHLTFGQRCYKKSWDKLKKNDWGQNDDGKRHTSIVANGCCRCCTKRTVNIDIYSILQWLLTFLHLAIKFIYLLWDKCLAVWLAVILT